MVCPKCGHECPDGASFCASCGVCLEEPIVIEREELDSAPEIDDTVKVSPSPEEDVQTPVISLNTQGTVKKKSPLVPILIGVGALVVALAVLVVLNFSTILSWFSKKETPREKLNESLKENINTTVDAVDDKLQQLGGIFSKPKTIEGEVQLDVNNSMISMVAGSMEFDQSIIEMLDNLSADYTLAVNENRLMATAVCKVANDERMTVSYIYDAATGERWFSIPEMNEKAVYITGSDGLGSSVYAPADFALQLLQSDKLKPIAVKFLNTVIDSLASVEKEKKTVTVGEVSQDLECFECTDTEENMLKALVKALEQMKTDKDIGNLLLDLENQGVKFSEKQDLQSAFAEGLDGWIEELNRAVENANDEEQAVLDLFVENDKISGFRLVTSEPEHNVALLSVQKDGKFAREFSCSKMTVLYTGENDKDGVISGKITARKNEEEILAVVIEDYIVKEDTASGTVKIQLGKRLLEAITESFLENMGMDSSTLAGFKPTLKIEFDTTKESAKFSAALLISGFEICSISSESKETEPMTITVPEDYIDVADTEAVEQWLQDAGY